MSSTCAMPCSTRPDPLEPELYAKPVGLELLRRAAAAAASYAELDRRLNSGELSLASRSPRFAPPDARPTGAVVAWFDGAMPQRGETVSGFVQGMHQHWLAQQQRQRTGVAPAAPVASRRAFATTPT